MKIVPLVAILCSLSLSLVSCSSESGVGNESGGQPATGGSTAGTGGRGVADSGNGSGGASASGGPSNSGAGSAGTASGGAGGNSNASGGGGGGDSGGTNAAIGGVGGRGGGAGMGGGGGGEATTFNPCPPAGTECKIMPLGDSITYGGMAVGGYRPELFRQSVMDMKKITFVGTQANGPDTVVVNGTMVPFPRKHEGYSGFTIDTNATVGRTGISSKIDVAFSTGKPDIVLLMIGTNDVNKDIDLPNAPTRLGKLLDRITTLVPNALLVVAKITPTKIDATNVKVQAYNDAIPGLVQTRVAAGKHIAMVDMYAAFTADANYKMALLFDDLHPNSPAGYALMGQTWYAGIKSYLR